MEHTQDLIPRGQVHPEIEHDGDLDRAAIPSRQSVNTASLVGMPAEITLMIARHLLPHNAQPYSSGMIVQHPRRTPSIRFAGQGTGHLLNLALTCQGLKELCLEVLYKFDIETIGYVSLRSAIVNDCVATLKHLAYFGTTSVFDLEPRMEEYRGLAGWAVVNDGGIGSQSSYWRPCHRNNGHPMNILGHAAIFGSLGIAQYLLDREGQMPPHHLSPQGCVENRWFRCPYDVRNPIRIAAYYRNYAFLELILNKGLGSRADVIYCIDQTVEYCVSERAAEEPKGIRYRIDDVAANSRLAFAHRLLDVYLPRRPATGDPARDGHWSYNSVLRTAVGGAVVVSDEQLFHKIMAVQSPDARADTKWRLEELAGTFTYTSPSGDFNISLAHSKEGREKFPTMLRLVLSTIVRKPNQLICALLHFSAGDVNYTSPDPVEGLYDLGKLLFTSPSAARDEIITGQHDHLVLDGMNRAVATGCFVALDVLMEHSLCHGRNHIVDQFLSGLSNHLVFRGILFMGYNGPEAGYSGWLYGERPSQHGANSRLSREGVIAIEILRIIRLHMGDIRCVRGGRFWRTWTRYLSRLSSKVMIDGHREGEHWVAEDPHNWRWCLGGRKGGFKGPRWYHSDLLLRVRDLRSRSLVEAYIMKRESPLSRQQMPLNEVVRLSQMLPCHREE
ncbi:hypothetical protein MKZ38_000009 [Zalerion maritima]|uniref:Uncharacterized protein n=1 Tax=Zalerion maritima TaxID=339359 RepID=A0AAD5RFT5_9PEZI|nr:hypothetical protein MKZ38_000009 [Zalerion maritima]